MNWAEVELSFLDSFIGRPLSISAPGLMPVNVFIGNGQLAVEIAVFTANTRPTISSLQSVWKDRRGARAIPLLVVAIFGDQAWLCGPSGETVPVHAEKDVGAIERLCASALNQPDRHAALLFLAQTLPSLDTPVPGIRNEGLFALHELVNDVPRRANWANEVSRSLDVLEAPWPRREEMLLREQFSSEEISGVGKAEKLVKFVVETGLEPFSQPQLLPPIMKDDIRLLCWIGVTKENESTTMG